jgi:hypothetical protein
MKSTHLTDPKTATRINGQSRCTANVTQLFETQSPLGEGVTGLKCPCCNGAGYRQTDLHEVEKCPFC